MKIEQAVRVFKYNGMELQDPGIAQSVEEVREFYANLYPELNNAEIEGPEHKAGKIIYEFRKAVGTKGAKNEKNTDLPLVTIAEIRSAQASMEAALHDAIVKFEKRAAGCIVTEVRLRRCQTMGSFHLLDKVDFQIEID